MTLLRLAFSMLLALGLAALSALSEPPAGTRFLLSSQDVTADSRLHADASGRRLASVEPARPRTDQLTAHTATVTGIVPPAGEFVPGAGQ